MINIEKQIQYIEVYEKWYGISIYALGDKFHGYEIGRFVNVTIPCEKHSYDVYNTDGEYIGHIDGDDIMPFYDTEWLERKRKASEYDKRRYLYEVGTKYRKYDE